MKWSITFLLLFTGLVSNSQTRESFDIASYTVPKNWKKEVKTDVVNYTFVNQAVGSYLVMGVYKSIAGHGQLEKDYSNEWQELVARRYTITGKPETETGKLQDGWNFKTGAATIKLSDGRAIAVLTVFEKEGTVLSMLALMNKEDLIPEMEHFISSVKLNKPEATRQPALSNTTTLPSTGKYQFTTSNFDDGWVSTVMQDYVLVENNGHSVYLLYHVPYNASQFSGTGLRDAEFYWENYVTQLFSVQSKQFNDGGSMALKPPYMEGAATDKRTGKKCFIGMYLLIVPNATSIVIGTAPDEQAFRKRYPKANDVFASDIAGMTRYNKFAVAPADVVGTWQNGNTSTVQWYYTSPSGYENYAGMTLASTSASFTFNYNGTYSSIHNGATGAVGNMNTFQQEYKGNYTVSNWAISASNRYGGKTDKFDASFVAVRGGRILRLNNGAGQEYNLVKVQDNQTTQSPVDLTPLGQETVRANARLFGKGNCSGASDPHYADAASWGTAGYITSRYVFKKNGFYLFTERSFRIMNPNIFSIQENRSFSVNGNQLTIVPLSSEIKSNHSGIATSAKENKHRR
ncbi:hypothetical protein [Flavihumibacter sp. ZG627]|uniref:hypothetical protein n=1 Tax=Flavihumibacter sp. ZG627 TaxID=1463156 RepID=UPI00057EF529|nr:hypothetical protein [Flavihumibacter sp. ZG627]KIC90525.1 hypothetical protein HY58_11280 [Flavihumibacter sp. ZG627]